MYEGIYNKMLNDGAMDALTKRAITRDGTIATGRDEHHGPIPVDINQYRPNAAAIPDYYMNKTTTIDDAGGAAVSPANFPRFGLYGGEAE